MTPRLTVIRSWVIGVDLPAFLLSKNFYSESIGTSRSTVLRPRLKLDRFTIALSNLTA